MTSDGWNSWINDSLARSAGERRTLVINGVEYAFRWVPPSVLLADSSDRSADCEEDAACVARSDEEEEATKLESSAAKENDSDADEVFSLSDGADDYSFDEYEDDFRDERDVFCPSSADEEPFESLFDLSNSSFEGESSDIFPSNYGDCSSDVFVALDEEDATPFDLGDSPSEGKSNDGDGASSETIELAENQDDFPSGGGSRTPSREGRDGKKENVNLAKKFFSFFKPVGGSETRREADGEYRAEESRLAGEDGEEQKKTDLQEESFKTLKPVGGAGARRETDGEYWAEDMLLTGEEEGNDDPTVLSEETLEEFRDLFESEPDSEADEEYWGKPAPVTTYEVEEDLTLEPSEERNETVSDKIERILKSVGYEIPSSDDEEGSEREFDQITTIEEPFDDEERPDPKIFGFTSPEEDLAFEYETATSYAYAPDVSRSLSSDDSSDCGETDPFSRERSEGRAVSPKTDVNRGLWMLESSVSREMWAAVMGETSSRFWGSELLSSENIPRDARQEYVKRLNELGVGPKDYEFSLPTGAEWEYARRVAGCGRDEPIPDRYDRVRLALRPIVRRSSRMTTEI